NVLDEVESKIIESRLEEEGVRLHYHTELESVLGKHGKVDAVLTGAGEKIPCGLVAFAIGIRPRLELAKAAGLQIDRGILVDEFLATSAPDVFAAGDVAQVYDPFSGRSILDSLWNPARMQGDTAGLNMAGLQTPYHKGVPFNVTRLAGLTTTIIGTVGGGKDEDLMGIARGDSETWRKFPDAIAAQDNFDVNRVRVMVGETSLRGAIVMGDQKLSKPIHHLIADEADIRPIRDRLLEPAAPIADLISDFFLSWKWGHAAPQP
ncbi:MAG TPA: FAD-dependent oxidoreductase, partial [Anaerolineales bacterium]|nr:FAD-dependent oxidoreductase [Anaerolineales bacterium]